MKRPLLALTGLGLAAAASLAAGALASELGPAGIVLHGPEQAALEERARIGGELRRFDVETRLHEARRMLEHELLYAPARRASEGELIGERQALDQRFYLERRIHGREIDRILDPRLRAESRAELVRIDIERRQRRLLKEQELRSRRAFERHPRPARPISLRPHRPGLGPHRPALRR